MKRRRKWILWLIACLLLSVVAVGVWLIAYRVEPMMENELRRAVWVSSKGKYRVANAKVRLMWWKSEVQLHHIEIVGADSGRVSVAAIAIAGVDAWTAYREQKIYIRSIQVDAPHLTLPAAAPAQTAIPAAAASPKQPFSWEMLYQAVHSFAKIIYIKNIEIENGTLTLTRNGKPLSVEAISLNISPVCLTPLAHQTAPYPLYMRQISFQANTRNAPLVAENRRVALGQISFSSDSNWLKMRDIAIETPALQLRSPRVSIQLNPFEALHRRLRIAEMEIVQPNLLLLHPRRPAKRDWRTLTPHALGFSEIDIAHIHVQQGQLRLLEGAAEGIEASIYSLHLAENESFKQVIPLLYKNKNSISVKSWKLAPRNGKYILSGEKTRIQAQQGRISVQHIAWKPTQAAQDSAQLRPDATPTLSDGSLALLQLSGLDWHALFQHQFLLQRIQIDSPLVQLYSYAAAKRKPIAALAEGSLYEAIKPFFKRVQIGELQVSGGEVGYQSLRLTQSEVKPISIKDIQVRAKNISLDENQPATGLPISAEDIALNAHVRGYSFMLPDSTYEIVFSRIGVSTGGKLVYADSVRIIPTQRSQRAELLSAFLPRIELQGLNVFEVYRDKRIAMQAVNVFSPRVEVEVRRSTAETAVRATAFGAASLNLYGLFSDKIRDITIGQVRIRDAYFRQRNYRNDTLLRDMILPHTALVLRRMRIDSMRPAMSDSTLLYADGLEVSTTEYRLPLADSVHELKLGTVYLDTDSRRMEIRNATVMPRAPYLLQPYTAPSPTRMEGIIPQFSLYGIDVRRILNRRELVADSVYFRQPTLAYRYLRTYAPALTRSDTGQSTQTFIGLLRSELHDVQIGTFRVSDGAMTYEHEGKSWLNSFQAKDLQLAVTDIALTASDSIPIAVSDIRPNVTLQNIEITLPDTSYAISVRRIALAENGALLRIDSAEMHPLRLPAQQGRSYADILMPTLRITGINHKEIYYSRRIDLQAMHIMQPHVTLTQLGIGSVLAPRPFNPLQSIDIFRHISPIVRGITIDTFAVSRGGVQFFRDDSLALWLPSVSSSLFHLALNDSVKPWEKRFLYADRGLFHVKNYVLPWNKRASTIHVKDITIDTEQNSVVLDSVSLLPLYEKGEYARQLGRQMARLEGEIQRVTLGGCDMRGLLFDRRVAVNYVRLDAPNLRVYRDKQVSASYTRLIRTPIEWMSALPITVRIDSSHIFNGSINFEQLGESSTETGRLYLDSIDVVLRNYTNDAATLRDHQMLTMAFASKFMETGSMKLNLWAIQNPTYNHYGYMGEIGKMDLREFNEYLPKTNFLSVTEGQLDRIAFEVTSKEGINTGEMRMYYRDLRLSVINKQNNERSRAMVSMLANAVVKSNNPTGSHLRVGIINYERNPYMSSLNDIIQSVLSGVKSSVGVGKDEKDKNQGLRDVLRRKRKHTVSSGEPPF